MSRPTQPLPPVEAVFDPTSQAYCDNPAPQCLALAERGRLVWYEPWQAWIMTDLADIMDCWKREYLSSDFYDWEFAPPRPPEEQWSNFERALIGHSLVADHAHHRRIRRITAPAFSRNVVDEIQRRIEPDVKKLFDDLGRPERFDYIDRVARHIPFISITRMVGIPEQYWPAIKPVVIRFTETWNPTISAERREQARADSNRAIDILRQVIEERRATPGQDDDFLSVLLKVERDDEQFDTWDIICLILALIGAGADTTLVAQQWSVYALLKNPDQVAAAMRSPDAFANAFNEIMRWSMPSKMGFARYAPDAMDLLGQSVHKGQMVLLMPHLTDHNPDHFADPDRFDVNRTFDPDVLFGYGPRYCIGAALAKRQLYLTLGELFRRFPAIALAGEPERDIADHNAVVFKQLLLDTHCR